MVICSSLNVAGAGKGQCAKVRQSEVSWTELGWKKGLLSELLSSELGFVVQPVIRMRGSGDREGPRLKTASCLVLTACLKACPDTNWFLAACPDATYPACGSIGIGVF
jgi:hypothetical protein